MSLTMLEQWEENIPLDLVDDLLRWHHDHLDWTLHLNGDLAEERQFHFKTPPVFVDDLVGFDHFHLLVRLRSKVVDQILLWDNIVL